MYGGCHLRGAATAGSSRQGEEQTCSILLRNLRADRRPAVGRARYAGLLIVAVLGAAALTAALVPGVARSALNATIIVNDQQGANDEPGQKDLTRFTTQDPSPVPGHLLVSFNHDKIGFTGSNTGDGCFLFDTDVPANSKADFVLCVTIGGTPATLQATREFSCGDASSFKCTNPTLITTFASTCTADQTSTDPFDASAPNGPGDAYPLDTTTACDIADVADFGADAELLDVCSYPSQVPNSDYSDCIIGSARPTAVALRSFAAHRTAKGVALSWRTGAEANNLGFNLFRQSGTKRVKVNAKLITGAGALAGHAYAFVDRNAPQGRAKYSLESVDRSGIRRVVSSTFVG